MMTQKFLQLWLVDEILRIRAFMFSRLYLVTVKYHLVCVQSSVTLRAPISTLFFETPIEEIINSLFIL